MVASWKVPAMKRGTSNSSRIEQQRCFVPISTVQRMNSESPSNHPMEISRREPPGRIRVDIKLDIPPCGTPCVPNWNPEQILLRLPEFLKWIDVVKVMKEVTKIYGVTAVQMEGQDTIRIFGDYDPVRLVKRFRRKYLAQIVRVGSNGREEESTRTENIPDHMNWPSGDDDDDDEEEVYYNASDLLFEERDTADSYQTPSIKCNCKNGAILVLGPRGPYSYGNDPLDRLFYECPNLNKEGVLPRCDFKIAAREERSSAMLEFLVVTFAELEGILVNAVHEKQMLQEKVVELSELNSGQEQVIEDLRKDFNNLKENIRKLI